MPQVTWVTKVDATFFIDGNIVGRIESPSFVAVGNDVTHSGLHVGSNHAPTTMICTLTDQHIPFSVELDAVGHATR